MKMSVEISGQDTGDLEIALERVLKLVRDGFTSGFDNNSSASFCFEIEGEEAA